MGALEGKSVLITGAGRGIGRAHALYAAAEGARVMVNDRGVGVDGSGSDASVADAVVDIIRAAGGTAAANHDDISTWEGAASAVASTVEAFGGLDGLVNNAGLLRHSDFFDSGEEEFDDVLRVHVKGTFACMRFACRYWRRLSDAGQPVTASIVNTTSESIFVGLPDPAYAAAKAAIAQLTLVGSVDAAQFGVRVNAIAPRAATRMSRASPLMVYTDKTPVLEAEQYTEETAVNPANASPIVAWLLSERSCHVSGQIFRLLAGAVSRATPWRSGEFIWPDGGAYRFSTVDDVDAKMRDEVFGARFRRERMPFAPGDPRGQVSD